MKIIFRVDANKVSGFGHFSRCLNLCRTWKASTSALEALFVGNYEEFALQALKTYEINSIRLDLPDFSTLLPSDLGRPDVALFDSYQLSQSHLNYLATCDFRSIILDDSCALNFEGIFGVINFRLDADILYQYSAKHSFLGKDFFIVKPELVKLRAKGRAPKDKALKVLLFTGGALSDNHVIESIANCILRVSPKIEITHIGQVGLRRVNNYQYVAPNPLIENYFAGCDVLLSAGGVIKYESAFSLIPTASFSTTKLQLDDSIILESKGLHCHLGDVKNIINEKWLSPLTEVLLNTECRHRLVKNSKGFFNDNPTLHLIKEVESVL